MRVALITHEYPGARPGGIGSYTLLVARTLAEAGHDPHIFTLTLPSEARAAAPSGVTLHDTADAAERVASGALSGPLAGAAMAAGLSPYKLGLAWLLSERVRAVHASHPFDIVESPEFEALGLPLMLRPAPGLAVVTQAHLGSALNRQANRQQATPEDDLVDALEAAALLAADGVYAATGNIASCTCDTLGIAREFAVIPYPTPAITQQPIPAPRDGPVLFVGRLIPRKGCDVLAQAATPFLRACPDAQLDIVGADSATAPDGGSMQSWMARQLTDDVRERVCFRGELSPAEVSDALRAARFAVVPSVVENFANTALDPMAAGRAVVYGGNTGLDEVVGDAGVRVYPLTPKALADALTRLWQDPARADALARAAAARIRTHFDAAHSIAPRIALYDRIRAAHAAGPADRALVRLAALAPRLLPAVLEALVVIAGYAAASPAARTLTPAARALAVMDRCAADAGRPARVHLFGAGRHTARLLTERHLFEARGHRVVGIIDDHPRFAANPEYLGLPVCSRAAFADRVSHGASTDAVLLSTDTQHELFWKLTADLRDRGVRVIKLYE